MNRHELIHRAVAILILLELTLQFELWHNKEDNWKRRNPYFIGINSAILYFLNFLI